MVTASDAVWDAYIVASPSEYFCIVTHVEGQSHPKAAPFCKKAFPLFDEIAEICEDTIANGANTFQVAATAFQDDDDSHDTSMIYPVLLQESESMALSRGASESHSKAVSEDEDQRQSVCPIRHLAKLVLMICEG